MTKLLPLITPLITAASALSLAACATLPPASDAPTPPADTTAWLALGTEPFWSLEITPARINYRPADGRPVVVANPGARPSFNGERYVTPQLTVDVTHAPCNDGMSDRRDADSVMVEVGGRTLRGCGGPVLPPASLDRTNWRIISINGSDIVGDRAATLRFAEGRVSGSAGCNQLSGNFLSDGNRLTVTQAVSTRMACDGPLMLQESALLALFRQSMAIRFAPDGRMILSAGESSVVLERVI
jgi:heat shock protein HslJ/uncharacterized membrane protein